MQNTFSYVSSLKLVEFLTFVGFATLLFLCLHDLNQAKWAAALLILACFKFFCIVVSPIWGAVAVSALLCLVSMLAQPSWGQYTSGLLVISAVAASYFATTTRLRAMGVNDRLSNIGPKQFLQLITVNAVFVAFAMSGCFFFTGHSATLETLGILVKIFLLEFFGIILVSRAMAFVL